MGSNWVVAADLARDKSVMFSSANCGKFAIYVEQSADTWTTRTI